MSVYRNPQLQVGKKYLHVYKIKICQSIVLFIFHSKFLVWRTRKRLKTSIYGLTFLFVYYLTQMLALACETEQEFFLQQLVHQKLQGQALPHPRCKASSLVTLAAELKQLKEDMVLPPTGNNILDRTV